MVTVGVEIDETSTEIGIKSVRNDTVGDVHFTIGRGGAQLTVLFSVAVPYALVATMLST